MDRMRRGVRHASRGRGQTLAAFVLGAVCLVSASALAVGDDGADGEFQQRDSFHFSLFQDVDIDERGGFHGSRRFEQEVLRQLEAAYDRLDALLGLRPDQKLVVYVWDTVIFDERFLGLVRFPIAGFYGGSIHIRGGEEVSPALVRVLHHELVHAAFDAEAPNLVLPAWMNEGMAEWFEARAVGKRQLTAGERGALERVAGRGGLLPLASLSTPSFGGFDSSTVGFAYLQSYGFIDHLAHAYGEKRLGQFWDSVVRAKSVERGARRTFRRDLEDLERDYQRSLGAS